MSIFTIGHSTRTLEEFVNLLKKYQIRCLIDVRRYPSSKKFPWFSKNSLEQRLKEENINYVFLGDKLGGKRKEGYERFMNSDQYREGIKNLIMYHEIFENVAIMCAERLYFRCHRRFISQTLTSKGLEVKHIT